MEDHKDNYFTINREAENQNPEKRNKVEEFVEQKQEISKPIDIEEDVDGFSILIPDPLKTKNKSLHGKIRKYFLLNPEPDMAKYRGGAYDMIDDFVIVQPDITKDPHTENKSRQALIDLAAGSFAGTAQVYVSQPLDTVKVKQQTFPKLYKNMFKCFLHTYRKDGVYRGLYAGSLPAVVASIAENSVLFAAYGSCQNAIAHVMEIDKVSEMSALGHALAGFFAAFFTAFTLCPTELIKCKLQAVREMKQYVAKDSKAVPRTAFKLTQYIFKTEGLPGFYRGLTPTLAREMPGYFFFFGCYEATREYFTEPGQSKEDIGSFKTMCSGALGGIALWTTSFPADVVKSRIQINNLKSPMYRVAAEIFRKEGILAFYNGLLPSILRTIPATATLFLVYEYTKNVLNKKF